MNKDIIKEYGNVLHDASSITERPLEVISVGPKLDIALGGGVPEGSLFIMTGPEKVGKTVYCLKLLCKRPEEPPEGDLLRQHRGKVAET